MATLTTEGLVTRTLQEIKEEIETEQREQISPAVDQSTTSLLGQQNAIISNALAQIEEGLAALYSAMDPNSAQDDALDRLSAITGTYRRGATATQVSCSLEFSQTGTYAAGTLLAFPEGAPDQLFTNDADIVVASVPYTATDVLFKAVEPGPTRLILGDSGPLSLTGISSPTPGWDSIEATSNLLIGTDEELDEQLRFRRSQELFNPGSTSINGIVAEVMSTVSGVIQCTVLENTSSVEYDGIPAYAIEPIVWGPTSPDDQIGYAIFRSKSAGTPTHGVEQYVVADSAASLHTIRFTRPEAVPVSLYINIGYKAGLEYVGDDAIASYIIEQSQRYWVPGRDIVPSQIIGWIFSRPGVLEVSGVEINGETSKLEISAREYGVILDFTDIQINSQIVVP
jgi:uncharacterized phage protein gp47/JayE